MDSLINIAQLLLRQLLDDYFKLTKHGIKAGEPHFYFTELNSKHKEFKNGGN